MIISVKYPCFPIPANYEEFLSYFLTHPKSINWELSQRNRFFPSWLPEKCFVPHLQCKTKTCKPSQGCRTNKKAEISTQWMVHTVACLILKSTSLFDPIYSTTLCRPNKWKEKLRALIHKSDGSKNFCSIAQSFLLNKQAFFMKRPRKCFLVHPQYQTKTKTCKLCQGCWIKERQTFFSNCSTMLKAFWS